MELTSDTQSIVIPESIRETVSEDGAVLLDIEQGICFSLNPVGLKIWGLLKKHYSIDQIVEALANDFEVPPSQLLADTLEFIGSLEAKRLIHRPGQPASKPSWLKRLVPLSWARNASGSSRS